MFVYLLRCPNLQPAAHFYKLHVHMDLPVQLFCLQHIAPHVVTEYPITRNYIYLHILAVNTENKQQLNQ